MTDADSPAPTPAPAAAPASAPPEAAPARRGAGGLLVVLLVLLAGGGGLFAGVYVAKHPLPALASLRLPALSHPAPAPGTPRVQAAPHLTVTPEPAPPLAPPAAPPPPMSVSGGPAVAAAPVQEGAASLLADARRAGTPREQVAALGAATGRLAALTAAGAAPADQVNRQAMSMARNEAAALSRSAAAREREVEATLGGWEGSDWAVAAVRRADANLNAAAAAVGRAPDGASAIEAARRAVAAYPAFLAAYTAAARYYVPAKHQEFWSVVGDCHRLASGVASYAANLSRGGAFATAGRRSAYREIQDQNARAQGLIGELDQLADYERGATDLIALDANLDRAQRLRQALYGLYASAGGLYAANK
ncbi:MAG TPA: hypothetical protein VKT30_10490 [Caulobacteraceae bacterium]|nr:hypothetical protein [Caulobacteraceae bacterium]